MPNRPQCFHVDVTFENDIDNQPAHRPLKVGVTRNEDVRTPADAEKWCLATIGHKEVDGKPVPITRIHHKVMETREIFSILTAKATGPHFIDETPVLHDIRDNPATPNEG